MKWFYERDGKKVGPISAEELAAQAGNGTVGADTLVWRPGLNTWVRFETVAHEIPGAETPPPLVRPAEASRAPGAFASAEPAVNRTAASVSGGPAEGSVALAGFGARAAARLIDMVLVWIGSQILISVVGALYFKETIEVLQTMKPGSQPPPELFGPILAFAAVALALMALSGLLYEIGFVAWRGATLGKLLLRLRVADERGQPLGVGAVVARSFAFLLNGLTFGLGFFLPLIDEQRRGLHDFVCGSRVVRGVGREEN